MQMYVSEQLFIHRNFLGCTRDIGQDSCGWLLDADVCVRATVYYIKQQQIYFFWRSKIITNQVEL